MFISIILFIYGIIQSKLDHEKYFITLHQMCFFCIIELSSCILVLRIAQFFKLNKRIVKDLELKLIMNLLLININLVIAYRRNKGIKGLFIPIIITSLSTYCTLITRLLNTKYLYEIFDILFYKLLEEVSIEIFN